MDMESFNLRHKITVSEMAPHVHNFQSGENKVDKLAKWLINWITLSLECGKIKPYDLMPSKADLACHIGVSQGTIQNVFVNSNSYSALGAGKFVMQGGNIRNIFVEYDSGYGAKFDYVSGNIINLMIATQNDNLNYYGVAHTLTPVENTLYEGGKLVYEESSYAYTGRTFDGDINSMLAHGNDYIFENCVFNSAISTTLNVGLIFNNCTFNSTDVNGETNLYLTSVTNLIVSNCTFNGNITNSHAIDLNLYSTVCENVTIANNIFNTTGNAAAITVRTRLGETDHPTESWKDGEIEGRISGLVKIAGNDFSDTNNTLIIGCAPQGSDTTANTSSGDFDVLVEENADILTIHNVFKDDVHVPEEGKVQGHRHDHAGLYGSDDRHGAYERRHEIPSGGYP